MLLLDEAAALGPRSVARADEIDYATTGDRLGRVMNAAMERDMGPYWRLRSVVIERLKELQVSDDKLPLFLLAADMATTARETRSLSSDDRCDLSRLWNDLVQSQTASG